MMGIPTTLISHQRNRLNRAQGAAVHHADFFLSILPSARITWTKIIQGSISLEDLRIQPKQVGKVDKIEAETSIFLGEGSKIQPQTGYDIGAEVKKNGSFCLKNFED